MIFGDIKNFDNEKRAYSPAIVKAIEFLKNTDLEKLAEGKYEIDGDKMYANVMERETKLKSDARAEIHKKYIDVQYLVSGAEIIGFARLSDDNVIVEDLLDKKDIAYYTTVKNENELLLSPGQFGIFFPDDIHRPTCAVGSPAMIKKVVVKIHVDLL